MYIVYKHSFGNKNYIGFTSLSLEERLHKHYLNTQYGIDTNFYRAIRKYGLDNIRSEILYECYDREEAIKKEIEYINFYDSYRFGYNMTEGGDGGDIISGLCKEDYEKYISKLKNSTSGDKNPRYIGYSDNELVDEGCKLYLNNNLLTTRMWQRHAKKNGLPMSFSKCRFDGKGMLEFKKRISDRLGYDINIKYKKTKDHISKLSNSSSNYIWVNKDGIVKRIHKSKEDIFLKNGFKKGRVFIDVLDISNKIYEIYGDLTYNIWREYMQLNELTPINFPKEKYSLKEIKKILKINNGDKNN